MPPQEGTPLIPANARRNIAALPLLRSLRQRFGVRLLTDIPQSLAPSAAFDAAPAAFNQLHKSLNGGSAGHGGIDAVPPPGPALAPELLRAP